MRRERGALCLLMKSCDAEMAFMRLAVEAGRKCHPVESAYNVGAVLTKVESTGIESLLASGFSRQLPGNTHAEECALLNLSLSQKSSKNGTTDEEKHETLNDHRHTSNAEYLMELRKEEDCARGLAKECILYTTMEPCSKRLSGNRCCTSRIIAAGISRVVVGVKEPPTFVDCEGSGLLKEAGVEVVYIEDEQMIQDCKNLNAHLLGS